VWGRCQVRPAAVWKQAAGNRLIDCLDMLGAAIQLYIAFACMESNTKIMVYVRMACCVPCCLCVLNGSCGCWFNLADRIFANPDHSATHRKPHF
jgi:hypothetical protein